MGSVLTWLGEQPDWLGYAAAGVVLLVGVCLGRFSRRTLIVNVNTAGMRDQLMRIGDALDSQQRNAS